MKSITIILLLILVSAGGVAYVKSSPAPDSPATLPDNVIANAVIAHKRLEQLHLALVVYMNVYGEQLDDPIHLLDSGILTPESFWHPGDNDPMPTTIDNSIPNAPNSAQISFLFRTGNLNFGLNRDDMFIWDASPMNNGGLFISYITMDGAIQTIPPVDLPFPTQMGIARHQMKRLGFAMVIYLNDNQEVLPPSLLLLHPDHISYPRSFWNPGDSDPMPTALTNNVPDALNSTNISFDFPLAGWNSNFLTPEMIVMQDNTPANNLGLGVYAIMGDFDTRFIPTGAFGDSNNDGEIDLADWAILQSCYTGYENNFDAIDDDYCRLHDFDNNAHVDEQDNAAFLQVMTAPGLP